MFFCYDGIYEATLLRRINALCEEKYNKQMIYFYIYFKFYISSFSIITITSVNFVYKFTLGISYYK